MKRKRARQGLETDALVPDETAQALFETADLHLNALRKGYARSLLAWSSQGTLAYVPLSADTLDPSLAPGDILGQAARLYTTVPAYDPTTKHTYLQNGLPQFNPHRGNTPIDHILFNEVGSFLAVVDEPGSITLWEQDNYANHLIPRQSFAAEGGLEEARDGTNDLGNRIVCIRWLHNDSKIHVASKLSKSGDQWVCQPNMQRGYGPCNSVGKEALIAITSDGKVKLVYLTPRGWRMEVLRLDGAGGETYGDVTPPKDFISHAAWTQDFFSAAQQGQQSKDHNLVGVAVLRRDPVVGQCVSYYKLMVDFRQDQDNPVRLTSTLFVNRDSLDLGGDVTHLFVLPTSHTLTSALAIVTLRTDEFGERKSSLAVWELTKSTSALHATFSQLSHVSNIPPPKDEAHSISLKQRCELPGVVISADIRIYASWITLGYLDGSVEVRKRTSIDRAEEPQDSPRNIMTPFDGGFDFPKPQITDERYIATVFSPNLVAYATLHASGKVTIHPMKSFSALNSVVVAQRFTNAIKKNVTFDDIYLLAEQHVSPDFAIKVVQQLLRFSNCRFEYTKETPIEQIFSGRIWDKIVSIQYNLYSRLDKGALIAGNAMLLLQLRAMFWAFVMSVKTDPSGPAANRRVPQNMGRIWLTKTMQTPKDFGFKESSVVALLGHVQWLMDYLVFVIRELLLVTKDLRQRHYEKEQDIPTMASMIFTNVVRTFLRAGIRASNDLLAFAKRYADQDVDVEPVHKHAYTMLESATRQSPITLEFAGKFLDEVDQVMEKILSENSNKIEIENKLFCESMIPRLLRKAIYTVTTNLIGPESPLDIPAVIFFDTTWLGLSTITPPAAHYEETALNSGMGEGAVWDTVRKQRLVAGRVRRCNRCGILSATDDPPVVNELIRRGQGGAQMRNWTAIFLKGCLCYGSWSLTEWGIKNDTSMHH